MDIIKFLGIILFTWLFVEGAAPIQFLKEFFKVGQDSEPKQLIRQLLQKLLNCPLCLGFWFGMIGYLDFWMACIVSVSAEIISRLLNLLFTKLQ